MKTKEAYSLLEPAHYLKDEDLVLYITPEMLKQASNY